MKTLLKIAWRNLFRHRGRSFVIGGILFFGTLMMMLGNGVINGLDKGIRANLVDRFLGDAVVLPADYSGDNIITGMPRPMPILQDFFELKQALIEDDLVKQVLPADRGMGMILNEENQMGFVFLFGVNFEDYQEMFHSNVISLEGKPLTNGDRGILITSGTRDRQYEITGKWIVPQGFAINVSNLTPQMLSNRNIKTQSELVLMGNGGMRGSTDVRLPVRGIIKYSRLNTLWSAINIMDIDSFRECFGYLTSDALAQNIDAEDSKLLNSDEKDLESLFSNSDFVVDVKDTISQYPKTKNSSHKKYNPNTGSYNLVMLKLKPNSDAKSTIAMLNRKLSDKGFKVRVVSWQAASGQLAQLAGILRTVLFVSVLFIFFVAALVIMNTLSMATLERTHEIAMMRAIGARRSFISHMLLSETFILSFFFGGLGILFGSLLIWILAALQIPAGNDIATLIFGGDVFRPTVSWTGVWQGAVQLLIVTLFAVFYPIRVASKIVPLQAIERD